MPSLRTALSVLLGSRLEHHLKPVLRIVAVAQQLRVLVAPVENPGLIPSSHITYNHLQFQSQRIHPVPSRDDLRHQAYTWCAYNKYFLEFVVLASGPDGSNKMVMLFLRMKPNYKLPMALATFCASVNRPFSLSWEFGSTALSVFTFSPITIFASEYGPSSPSQSSVA